MFCFKNKSIAIAEFNKHTDIKTVMWAMKCLLNAVCMAREFTATRQARTVACTQHDRSTGKRKRTDISFPLTPRAYKKCICINKAELSALLLWYHLHWRWVGFRQKHRRVTVSAVTGRDLPPSYYRVARVWASWVTTDSTENAPSDSCLSHLTCVAAVLHPLSEKEQAARLVDHH